MSVLVPTVKKNLMRRGSVNVGRRRSSVSQIEGVVFKIMEAEENLLVPEIETDKKEVTIEEEKKVYQGKRRLVHQHFKLFLHFFYSRGSAYFEKDGERRGYAFEDMEDIDLLIDEKLKDVEENEQRQKEDLNKERIIKTLDAMKKIFNNKT
jgi:hypothetical protein